MFTEPKKMATHGTVTDQKYPSANVFDGKLVSLTGNKLVMTDDKGREYSHTLAMDARLTCDGKVCKSEDFKAGSKIRISTRTDDRNVATCIESLNENAEFAKCS